MLQTIFFYLREFMIINLKTYKNAISIFFKKLKKYAIKLKKIKYNVCLTKAFTQGYTRLQKYNIVI
jgi:hypothetical protein